MKTYRFDVKTWARPYRHSRDPKAEAQVIRWASNHGFDLKLLVGDSERHLSLSDIEARVLVGLLAEARRDEEQSRRENWDEEEEVIDLDD